MSLMTALKLRPADDVATCQDALAKLHTAAAGWRAELAAIPTALDAAIGAEDNATADKLEASATILRRSIRKSELDLPILQRRLFEAEEQTKERFIAKAQAQRHRTSFRSKRLSDPC